MALNTLKNAAAAAITSAAINAIKKKYAASKKPAEPKESDEEKELGVLADRLYAAKVSLNAGIDRLIARADKRAASNSELIKLTDQLNSLAKKLGY